MMIDHNKWMQIAIDEALKYEGLTKPNPMVGAVLVHAKTQTLMAKGGHKKYKTKHAEVVAIEAFHRAQAKQKIPSSIKLGDCTLYVTLEPCSHYGNTGPCAEFIVQSGIKNVVIATKDSNPLVKNKGISLLKKNNISVRTGVLKKQSQWMNRVFHFSHGIVDSSKSSINNSNKNNNKKKPWVIVKTAQSLDGKITDNQGRSKWITGKEARADGRSYRAKADAIIVGRQTMLADNPHLGVRHKKYSDPIRVVIDSDLKTIKTIKQFYKNYPQAAPTLVYHSKNTSLNKLDKHNICNIRNNKKEDAQINCIGLLTKNKKNNIAVILNDLYQRGVQSVLVEGGATTLGVFFEAGFVDEYILYQAPIIMGGTKALSSIQSNKGLNFIDSKTHKPIIDKGDLISTQVIGKDIKTTIAFTSPYF